MTNEKPKQVLLSRTEFVHVSDKNTGVVTTIVGPRNYTAAAHQSVGDIQPFMQLGEGEWIVVENPVIRDSEGDVLLDDQGQVLLDVGRREQRIGPCHWPTYSGEKPGKIHSEFVLRAGRALHVRVINEFEEANGTIRSPGDEYLVKGPCKFIPPLDLEIVDPNIEAVTVPAEKYVVLMNPRDESTEKNAVGKKKIIVGATEFYVQPGEHLTEDNDGNIFYNKYVLGRSDGVYVQALASHTEKDSSGKKIEREEGTSWLVRGPQTFVPDKDVQVLGKAVSHSLGDEQGCYVKDWSNGKVRLETGPREIVLQPWEALFQKKLSRMEELTISLGYTSLARMRKDPHYLESITEQNHTALRKNAWEAVALHLPDNTIAKVHDYKNKSYRILYGPTSSMLGPWETAAILELSAGKPLKPKELLVFTKTLGPDFIKDEIEVATADHTRLRIHVSYKWRFEITGNPEEDDRVFKTPDSIGFAGANLASIIREATAQHRFEFFHQHAGKIIREAVFGFADKKKGTFNDRLEFPENGLQIIAIDLERVEPIDEKIAEDLAAAIKTNIAIGLEKLKADALAESKLAEIDNEAKQNDAQKNVAIAHEKSKQELILLQIANERLVAEKKAELDADIASMNLVAKIESLLRHAEAEGERLKQMAEVVGADKAAEIEIARATASGLTGTNKLVVPHDMTLHLHEIEK